MINFIKTENAFNKVLRQGLRFAEEVQILFVSPYDEMSKKIINYIEEGNHNLKAPLHVVDSFETPHAFVACKTTGVPCLVSIKNRKKLIEYYVPVIYERVGIDAQ